MVFSELHIRGRSMTFGQEEVLGGPKNVHIGVGGGQKRTKYCTRSH